MKIQKLDSIKTNINAFDANSLHTMCELPLELCQIMKEDINLFYCIYKFVYNNFKNGKSIEIFKNGFQSKNYTSEKNKFIQYFNIIHSYIQHNNETVQNKNTYDINTSINDNSNNKDDTEADTDTDIDSIGDDYEIVPDLINNTKDSNFKLRPNQEDIQYLLDEKGLVTGIHCQATGLGKSIGMLLYVNYVLQCVANPNIIIFTERISILRDLFGFGDNTTKSKIKYWKSIGVCDLTKINVIDCVTDKKHLWVNKINDNTKMGNLLVINRAYLTKPKNGTTRKDNMYDYHDIVYDNINLILHDECHNVSSDECFKFLSSVKDNNIPIVGFSATPLRTKKDDLKRASYIYGDNEQLNLLTNYNLLHAISNKLILPIKFFWYQLEWHKLEGNKKEMDMVKNLESLAKLLDENLHYFTNKKMVVWCGTIKKTKDMENQIINIFHRYSSLSKFKIYIDHSEKDTDDYFKFVKEDEWSILLCAVKHREGSDIRRLDSVIFMDGVKNRGAIPFIQSIGRPIRKDSENPDKKYGIVIDGFLKSDEYELEIINKIFDYYMYIMNVSLNNKEMTKHEMYWKAKDMIDFDVVNKKVIMKLGNETVEINFNNFNLENIKLNFDASLQKKIKLSAIDNIKNKGAVLKNKYNFNAYTDFHTEYLKLYTNKKFDATDNMPDIRTDEYESVFKKYSWFDILDLKHNFYENQQIAKKELVEQKLIKTGLTANDIKQKWQEYCQFDEKLPPYPQYVWGDTFTFKYFACKPTKHL